MTLAEHATQFERFVQEVQHRTAVQKSERHEYGNAWPIRQCIRLHTGANGCKW